MSILAGSLASKFSLHLQSRAILISIPWVKRNARIACSKSTSRDQSTASSVPIRYIPKRDSSEVINEFEKSKKRVFLDDNSKHIYKERFLFDNAQQGSKDCGISGLETEINIDVSVTQCKLGSKEFSETAIQHERDICKTNGQSCRTMQDAEKMAIEFLASRAFTAVELRKKLHGKRFPSDIVEALITDFQSRGLINDSLYAETFSRSRWSSLSWGPRRIKQALFRKGVSEADADKAIKLVFKDYETGDQELKLGMSKNSMEHLLVQASKQWLRGQDVPKETRKSRIIRWLQYRGFNWGVISFILKKLESQNSS